jgi:hypothetical protein
MPHPPTRRSSEPAGLFLFERHPSFEEDDMNEERHQLGIELSVPGKLRLAAELVATASRVPLEEREDVVEKAIELALLALAELYAAASQLRERSTAKAAGALLARIAERKAAGQNVLTSGDGKIGP